MFRYVIKRLLLLIPILLAVSFLVFFVVNLAPADAVDVQCGSEVSVEEKNALREELGLNDPLVVRYLRYIKGLLHGNLGTSSSSGEPVFDLYMAKLPNTLLLAALGMCFSLLIAIPLGIIAALKQNSWLDAASTTLGLLGISLPCFWLGLVLILTFSYRLDLLPSYGDEHWYSVILPAITVGASGAALLLRTTRSSMLEVIRQDYVRTARAKGVSERNVILSHALKNALIPIVTVAGTSLSSTLGGAVVTETIFAWPGVGRLIINGIGARDIELVTGGIIMTSILTCVMILSVDILYSFIDPRIKARYSK